MAYAPTNIPHVLGGFREADFGYWFEYAAASDTPFPGYNCKLFCGHGLNGWPSEPYRWARIIKTRAYVITDEGPEGEPVVETWHIRGHREYT